MTKVLLLIGLFTLPTLVWAQRESEIFSKVFKSKSKWVPTTFIFQNKDIGEAPVKFVGNEAVAILNSRTLLEEYLREDLSLNDTQITFAQLESKGIELSFNEEKFFVEVNIRPELIKQKTTSFSFDYRPQWVKEVTPPSKFSFYTNLHYYRPYTHNTPRDNSDELDIQPNLNIHGVVIESSHTYQNGQVKRNNTRALYDFQSSSTRLSIGDSTTPSTDYLSGVSLLGASFGKDFSLRPYDTTVPRGKAEFELRETSTVRVFVNGTLINILKLDAGTHKLEDLPLIQGLNEIKLVVESELGRVDEIIIPAAFSQDLLKVGLSDFYYGVGKKSNIVNNERTYAGEDYLYTAFYRRGVSDTFTVGGFLQADQKAQLLGSDQVFSTQYGQIKTQLAGVRNSSETGFSLKGEYFFLDQREVGVAASGHLFGLEYRDKFFTLIGGGAPSGYNRNILSYSFNKNIYGYSYRVGGQYELSQGRENTWALTGSLGKTFKRRFNVNTVAGYRTLMNGSDSFEISLYFSWFLPEKGHNLYGSYNSLSKTSQISLQKIKTSSDDDLSYQFTGRDTEFDKSIEFDSRYEFDRFEVGYRHSQEKLDAGRSNWDRYNGNIKVSTSLAFAGNNFTFGRPITNSFAILTRDKNLVDENILINSNGDQIAKAGVVDNILVSKVQPYRYYRLSAEGALLSDGLSLKESDFALMPTYKSGSVVALKAKGSMSIYGKMVLPDNTMASLTVFDVLDSKGKIIYGSFTNRKGRLLIEGLESGKYVIRLQVKEEQYEAPFDLPENKVGFINVGAIKLKKVRK